MYVTVLLSLMIHDCTGHVSNVTFRIILKPHHCQCYFRYNIILSLFCEELPHKIRTCCEFFFAPVYYELCKSMEDLWFMMMADLCRETFKRKWLSLGMSHQIPTLIVQVPTGSRSTGDPGCIDKGSVQVLPVGCKYSHWKFAKQIQTGPNKS